MRRYTPTKMFVYTFGLYHSTILFNNRLKLEKAYQTLVDELQ